MFFSLIPGYSAQESGILHKIILHLETNIDRTMVLGILKKYGLVLLCTFLKYIPLFVLILEIVKTSVIYFQ